MRRRVDLNLADVFEDRAACPIGIALDRARHGPTGFDLAIGGFAARGFDGLANGEQFLWNNFRDAVLARYDWVFQSFGERAGDVVAERGDEVNPIRTQKRRQDRNRNDDAAAKVQLFGHDVHDLVVRENFRAADVEDAGGSFRMFECAGEVAEDVANGDGLARSANPLGRDHDGKSLDEVAENLERGGAGADDHRGAKGGDRDSAIDQSFFDGATRGEMLAESGASFTKTAEINDAADARLPGGAGEGGRELEIVIRVFLAGGEHRMNEVIRGRAAFQRAEQSGFIGEIELDDDEIRMIGPRAILKFARGAHEAADGVSGVEEAGDEAAADVAGGAGDGDGGVGHR